MSPTRQTLPRGLLIAALGAALCAAVVFGLLPALSRQSAGQRRPAHFPTPAPIPRSSTPAPSPVPRSSPPAPWELAAARRAFAALQLGFTAPGGLFTKYYREPKYAGAWAVAQVMDAEVALARLPGGGNAVGRVEALFGDLQPYWDAAAPTPAYDKEVLPPLGPGGHKFFDDNALIGLALVRGYGITHDSAMLGRAQQVFAFERSGWDRSRAHPLPGGLFWQQQPDPRERTTVSTAGAAQLGLRLYLLTGRRSDLHWALRMYRWVDRTMRAPDGLYWDHVGLGGGIGKATWTYNQGLMLGDSALLYRVTGRRSYMRRAEAIADATLARLGDRLREQRPIINAIFFVNLLALQRQAPDPAYLRATKRYAAFLRQMTDPGTGVLAVNQRPLLLDQAALVQVDAYLALAQRQRQGAAGTGPRHRGRLHRKLT